MSHENGKIKNISSTGSLKDSSGNCFADSVVGTFYNGITPGSDTAYVLIKVDVKTTGTYNISTDMQNGFSFSDSGYFNTTGINTITLKPSGTPILPIITDFTVTFDTSVCMFSINVKDSTGTGLGGSGGSDSVNTSDTAWQFSNGTTTFHGPVDTAILVDSMGLTYLNISGTTAAAHDSTFKVGIFLTGGVINVGDVYSSTTFLNFSFSDASGLIYVADASTPGFEITLTITGYDAVNKIIIAAFSGTAKDASGNTVNIPAGSFTVKIT